MAVYQEKPTAKSDILKKYRDLYKLRKERKEDDDITYDNRNYPRRVTEKDKKIERSRFEYRGTKLGRKHFLIGVLMFFMILFLCEAVSTEKSNYTLGGYIFLFVLLLIAFRYNVNSAYYFVFIILFLIHFSLTKSYNILLPEYELIKNSKNSKNSLIKKK